MSIIDKLKEKPLWAFASLLSIIYAVFFVLVSEGKLKNDLLFGFCVWGSPEEPTEAEGCKNSPINSHLAACIIDAIMTGLAAVFYFKDKNEKKKPLTYIATGFIIFAHGFLHYFLQQTTWSIVVDCYNPELGKEIEGFGFILFGVFSFVLCLIILSFGFEFKLSNFVYSIIFAGIVQQVTKSTGGELVLPGLFVIVHPLSCITGLLSDEPSFNPTVAKWFVICTLVGIIELSSCTSVLKPIGGHLWYDVTLHSAVLASLPYFSLPEAKGKKD